MMVQGGAGTPERLDRFMPCAVAHYAARRKRGPKNNRPPAFGREPSPAATFVCGQSAALRRARERATARDAVRSGTATFPNGSARAIQAWRPFPIW
jgi:hypothetical protein